MAIVTLPNIGGGVDPATINVSVLNGKVDPLATDYNGNIQNVNIAAAAGIVYSKLALTDGILNADINSAAAIVDTKLATISTAGKVSGAALTSLSSIPSGAGVIPVANIPSAPYKFQRNEMFVVQATSTTMTVGVGDLEVNGTLISKTTATTLTLTTAGNWAGGSSLQATGTYGYVGVDVSGNIKMHTTAPSHSDYAVSNIAGTKRFATWSSTVYRIIGWFYMNSTGSGELFAYEVGNLRDGSVQNTCYKSSANNVNSASTTAVSDTEALIHGYSSGRPTRIIYSIAAASGTSDNVAAQISLDGSADTDTERWAQTKTTTTFKFGVSTEKISTPAQGTRTIQGQFWIDSGTAQINKRSISFEEL